jgi:ATP-binding cassette subfamily B protein/subfamily B ATP-binding cassette protein MsbA
VALPLVVSLTNLVAMFAVMWQLSRPLALVAISIAVPLGFVVKTFARPMSESKHEKKRLQGEMTSLAEQALSAVPLVQGFGQEEQEDDRFQRVSRRTADASLRATRVQLQFKIVTGLVTAIATAAVMAIGGLQVLHGSLTVGALLVLLYYFGALYSPLETIAYLSDGLASASAGARRVLEVLGSGADAIRDDPNARPLDPPGHGAGAEIRLEAVTFGYEPDRPVLRQVMLDVRPGEVVALVGPTGAGKSTLLSLIPRFFDPSEGAVLVNGRDVRGVRLSSLRAQIAVVFQESFLFPLSIADNIAYGRPGAGRDEIIAAATAARAHEFIERLPEGYDSVIGERGATLSGGEKQRLAIARALLKDAPILLLDEPTSALDAFTESSLMEALEELMRGRTTIIIAHRLSTIRNADRVVALEGGRIVEQGKPPGLHRVADR